MSAGVASVRARGWSRGRGGAGVVGGLGGAAMVLLVGLGAGLLLAGCAGDPVPSPTYGTPPVSTPTPTPTPTGVTAPERPADMERTDEAGAVAAATYFMELYAYAMRSGDLDEWDAVSASSCEFCARTRASVASLVAAGSTYRGGGLTVRGARAVGVDDTFGVHAVDIDYSSAEASVVDANGVTTDVYPAADGLLTVEVAVTSTGWTLVGGRAVDEAAGE